MFFRIIFLLTILMFSTPSNAQNFGIVAEVNGEPISNFALSDRVNLIVNSSGLANSPELRSRVANQALQALINEALQRQEATNLGIKITDKDMQSAMAEIEEKNNVKKGGFDEFVKSQGIDKDSLLDQLKTQLIWKKIVTRRILPRVTVSDFEIQDTLKWIASKKGGTKEVFISSILFPASNAEESADALALANKLVSEIRGGADYKALAKQFPSSDELGWIPLEKLQDNVQSAIAIAGANSITEPIKTEDGYRIFKTGEIRMLGKGSYNEDKVREVLTMQKLELESRRYIKDLRQKAYIEIRN